MTVRHAGGGARKQARLVAAALAVAIGASLAVPAGAAGPIDWKSAREHWSFQVPAAHPLPAVKRKDWPRQPVDRFILARLEQAGLTPSPEADPRTLIRRVTLDLTGLPPTPEEVAAFVQECQQEALSVKHQALSVKKGRATGTRNPQLEAKGSTPDAYRRVVDRLLASPRFGERMASMWLPLARYAEDQAHQVGSDTQFFYPNAHLYRNWVIDAFNRDIPYDQFVKLQLAADVLPEPVQVQANTPRAVIPVSNGTPAPAFTAKIVSPKQELAALGFLGLGPKYYNRGRLDVMADEWQDRVDTVTRTFLGLTVACARCHDHKYDPIPTSDYYALAGVFASTKMVNQAADGKVDPATDAAKMGKDTIHVVQEDKPHDLNIFLRGNVDNKGPVEPRHFLRVLSNGEPAPFKEGSGRKELAEAIASPTNPLTARVMVNRVWGLFFGQPLVSTPSNFGLIGDTPSHPDLLDDLAVRFERDGWSIKTLVRELVLSSTYRQSSGVDAVTTPTPNRKSKIVNRKSVDPLVVDGANRLLWRMNRRRFTVEQWRDSVLFVSGILQAGGGPSLELTDAANHQRTVYARVSRLKLNDLLMQFDYPDANVHAEKRSVTTTPMQKLFMLNSPLMQEQARDLAARLTSTPGEGEAVRVRHAYRLLYGRDPQPVELKLALDYLQKPEAQGMSRWERYAQVLLVANEMLYID
jgi:hypothetical protein